jgi:uroporphyrin-3 C-methyltransferase
MAEEQLNATSPELVANKEIAVNVKAPYTLHVVIAAMVVVLSLIALGLSGYSLLQLAQLKQTEAKVSAQTNHKFEDLTLQYHQVLEKINDTERLSNQSVTQLEESVQKKLQDATDSLKNTLEKSQLRSQDWSLFRARYYLELAYINAFWGQDNQTTSALLTQADQILKEINEQALFPIREALAKEILEVNSTPQLDKAGLLNKLNALQSQISQLEIKNPSFSQAGDSHFARLRPTWKEAFWENINQLKKLIIVRRNNQSIALPIGPEEEALMRGSLQFSLQQAQWAILQADQPVFNIALEQAQKIVGSTFDQTLAGNKKFMQSLEDLKSTKLAPKAIDLSESVNLLNNYINTKLPSYSHQEANK